MEMLIGETLAARLEKGRLPLEQALSVGIKIADALSAAHRQGVVHRDLKPANVMLTKSGAKLLDFGVAKLTGHGDHPAVAQFTSAPTHAVVTDEGVIVGTLQYMAPEQLEGKPADAHTDIWALGAVLHEMITGRRAFEGTSPASVMGAILEREPVPLAALQPLTPPHLNRLVRRCMTKTPDDRPDTAHDVAEELRSIAAHGMTEALDAPRGRAAGKRPGTLPSKAVIFNRSKQRLVLAVAVVVPALLTGLLTYVFATRNAVPATGAGDAQMLSGRPLAAYPFYPVAVSNEGVLYIDKIRFMEAVRALQQTPDVKAVADLLYLERKENVTLQLGDADRSAFQALVRTVRVPDFARQEAHRDRLFEVFKQIVNGLGQSFAGTPIEIVLHDVRNPMQSIQALQNPISGRRLYQPTTNFGLELIKWYATHPQSGSNFISYDLVLANGTTLKSTTIPLYDQDYGLLGFVCMNIDIRDISETRLDEKTKQFLAAFRRTSSNADIAEIVGSARKNLSLKRAGE